MPRLFRIPAHLRGVGRPTGWLPSPLTRPAKPGHPLPQRERASRAARRGLAVGVVAYVLLQAGFRQAVVTDALAIGDPIWADKLHTLQARPAPPALLAVGSSRTQLAFDAERFTRATGVDSVNFGTPAGGPLTTALYLRRLLAAGHRPRTLLVELHPGFLTPGDPPFEGRWLHAYRLRAGEPAHLRRLGWDVPDPPHAGWRGRITATAAWRMGLLNECAPTWLPCPFGLTPAGRADARGWVPGIDLKPHERPRALRRTREHYAAVLDRYDVGGPGCEAVRDVLLACRGHGIRPVLLLTPESSEHRGWYGDAGYQAITAFAGSLGVPVVDARDWLPDELIADGHHLTPAGAGAFTDRLAVGWASGVWRVGRGE